jgi:tRNA threonylcarbamoyladenosine biosynthesis protein TsaE
MRISLVAMHHDGEPDQQPRYNDRTMQADSAMTASSLRDSAETLYSSSAIDTQRLGERLGALLFPGDVIFLMGELGAGKTCLTQGIARGLGIDGWVCSPTFILVGEYRGRVRLYHADLYRLEDPIEVADLDLARLSEDGVLIVEWPERAPEWLPAEYLLIQIEHAGGDNRRIDLRPAGGRSDELITALKSQPLT